MLSTNIYNIMCDKWSADKSKAPHTLTELIGSDDTYLKVSLSNMVLRTLKSICIDNGDTLVEVNEYNSMLSYNDVISGVILQDNHLRITDCTLQNAIRIVNTLPGIDIILSSINEIRANKVPKLSNEITEFVKAACFQKLNGNNGYERIEKTDVAYNDYVLPFYVRVMLSNTIYSVNNGLPINTDYNVKSINIVANAIKTFIQKRRIFKDTLPKNAVIPIMEIIKEWIISDDKTAADKLKDIGLY